MTQLFLPVNLYPFVLEHLLGVVGFDDDGATDDDSESHICFLCASDPLEDIATLAEEARDGVEQDEQDDHDAQVDFFRGEVECLRDIPVPEWHRVERFVLKSPQVESFKEGDVVCLGNGPNDPAVLVTSRSWTPLMETNRAFSLLVGLFPLSFFLGLPEEQAKWDQVQQVMRNHGWAIVDDYESFFYKQLSETDFKVPDHVPEDFHL